MVGCWDDPIKALALVHAGKEGLECSWVLGRNQLNVHRGQGVSSGLKQLILTGCGWWCFLRAVCWGWKLQWLLTSVAVLSKNMAFCRERWNVGNFSLHQPGWGNSTSLREVFECSLPTLLCVTFRQISTCREHPSLGISRFFLQESPFSHFCCCLTCSLEEEGSQS